MPVLDIIEEASAHLPVNESTTCEWVIVPTLLELGYKRWEIVSRVADSNGQFPDYTILPDTDSTWYLEAKAWNVALQDSHVNQSINYANQNAKRWVVLTNGQTWRLYDNDIKQATPSGKLVASAGKDDTVALETLLNSLSRDSVSNGGLERYADNSRLASELSSQLRDENSEVVRAIWNVLKKRPGLANVTRASITEHFGASASAIQPQPISIPTTPTATPLPSNQYRLSDLSSELPSVLSERKPSDVRIGSQSASAVRTWVDVTCEVVKRIVDTGVTLPLPFPEGKHHSGFLINRPRSEADDRRSGYTRMNAGGEILLVNCHLGDASIVRNLTTLCRTCGIDPATITITLA